MNLDKLKNKKLNELKISELREICMSKKRKKERGIWRDKLVFPFVLLCLYLGLSATFVTFLWLFIGIIGTILLWFGNYWLNVIGILLFLFGLFIDWVDGGVNRYYSWKAGKRLDMLTGKFIDRVFHYIHRPLMLLGIGIGSWVRFGNIYFFYFGIASGLMILWDHMIRLKEYEVLIDKKQLKFIEESYKIKTKGFGKWEPIYSLFKPESVWLFLICAILNILPYLLILFTILFVGRLFKTFYSNYKRMKELDKRLESK